MAPFFMLDNFLAHLLEEQRASKHTVDAYKRDLEQFFQSFELDRLSEINSKLLREWVRELHENGMSNRTINRKLSAVRSFHVFLKREGEIDAGSSLRVVGPKSEKRTPAFIKEKELPTRLHLLHDELPYGEILNILLVEVLYQTGMRLTELIDLKNQQVEDTVLRVIGKRKKERIVPLSDDLSKALRFYSAYREKQGWSSSYFFLRKSGEKLYPKLVYREINSYLGEVTNSDKRSPHVLRHTFATHMLNNGAGLETIREILGHANLSATQVYTHNSFTEIARIYSQAHPRGHKAN